MNDLYFEHSQHKGQRAIMSDKCSECYKEFHPTKPNKYYTRPKWELSANDYQAIENSRNPLK